MTRAETERRTVWEEERVLGDRWLEANRAKSKGERKPNKLR